MRKQAQRACGFLHSHSAIKRQSWNPKLRFDSGSRGLVNLGAPPLLTHLHTLMRGGSGLRWWRPAHTAPCGRVELNFLQTQPWSQRNLDPSSISHQYDSRQITWTLWVSASLSVQCVQNHLPHRIAVRLEERILPCLGTWQVLNKWCLVNLNLPGAERLSTEDGGSLHFWEEMNVPEVHYSIFAWLNTGPRCLSQQNQYWPLSMLTISNTDPKQWEPESGALKGVKRQAAVTRRAELMEKPDTMVHMWGPPVFRSNRCVSLEITHPLWASVSLRSKGHNNSYFPGLWLKH